METAAQQVLEEIHVTLKNIATYIQKIVKEEIKIDSEKIALIDYSNFAALHKPVNSEIKKRLEDYNRQAVQAAIADNFVDFCRCIYLQIEILLNKFIVIEFGKQKTNDWEYYKKARLADFIKVTCGCNPYDLEEYEIIKNIMDIRDIASHSDHNGKSIEERVEAKGKSINIYLNQLNNSINEEKTQKIFASYLNNPDQKTRIKVRGELTKGYAYLTLYNLKYEFFAIENVINDLEKKLNLLQ